MNAHVKCLPFHGRQDVCAWQIGFGAVDVGQPVQPPSDSAHQDNVVLEAFCGLQAAAFDAAAGFDDFVKDFNLPAAAVPRDDLQRLAQSCSPLCSLRAAIRRVHGRPIQPDFPVGFLPAPEWPEA